MNKKENFHLVKLDSPVVVKSFNEKEFQDQVQSYVTQGYTIDYMNTSVRVVNGNKIYAYYAELKKNESKNTSD